MLIQIQKGQWIDSSIIKEINVTHMNYFELNRTVFCVVFATENGNYYSDEFEHKADAINFARCVAARINNLEESP